VIKLSIISSKYIVALSFAFLVSSTVFIASAAAQDQTETAQKPVQQTSASQSKEASKQSTREKVSAAEKMGENYSFDNPKDRKTFLKLTAELRCPMCQNQNIADSDAMIAHDMRRKVYQLMLEGSSEQEVIDYMKERYGDFVYYQPPVTPVTIWLWALPVLFAFIMMGVFIKRREDTPVEDVEAKLAAANKLLKDE
jgi:cytochrome c-type biogenesis protein CcmH